MTAAAVAAVACFVRFGTKWIKKALEIPDDAPMGVNWEGGATLGEDGSYTVGAGSTIGDTHFEQDTRFASESEFEQWCKEHGYL